MRALTSIVAVVAGLALVGPLRADEDAVDPRFVLHDHELGGALPAGAATIRFVREQFVRLRPLPPELVYVDDVPVGLLPQRAWLEVVVAPGWHRVCGLPGARGLQFHCSADRRYLLRMREVIDAADVRAAHWLLDDVDLAGQSLRRFQLRCVETTPAGLRYLERKHDAACRATEVDTTGFPGGGDGVSFDPVLIERPLDPVNLERDFSNLTGSVWIDASGLRYRLRVRVAEALNAWRLVQDSLDVPADSIVAVRFGGTRYTGVNPWVDLVHRTPSGLRVASFAAAREEDGVRTYNGIFAALEAVRASRSRRALRADEPRSP